MKLFLLSPYHTGSHQAWAEGYARYSSHEVHLLTMAGRFWKWRMQGGGLELAKQVESTCQKVGPPDILLVTDMVNVPALLALSRPWLDGVPLLFYVHENQLTYPPPPGEKRDLTYGMINTLSMAVADVIAFNSQYHLEAFFEELPRLLKHFPDYNHLSLIKALRKKSRVLPVGLDLQRLDVYGNSKPPRHAPLRILWNQRWEYDKNPAEFFDALYALQKFNVPFEVIIAGENYRQRPHEFDEAESKLSRQLMHFGYADDFEDYAKLLWMADLVVSTAHHEFFGISILEAMYCDCYPLLPNRLSYPELLPPAQHHSHLYHDFDDLVSRLRWAASHTDLIRASSLRTISLAYAWETIAPVYDELLVAMANA